MRLSRSLAILAFSLVVLCGAGFADSTFDFSSKGNGDIGHTDTFTAGAGSITLWGFSNTNTNTDLFFKNGAGDENGLGLNDGDGDNEISGTAFIQFTTAGITSVKIGSVQSGESFALYGSNTLGTLGTLLTGYTGTADKTVSLPSIDGTWKYVSVFSPTGNVLLDNAKTASSVPEPSTPALVMSLGLVGLVAFGGRKLGKISI